MRIVCLSAALFVFALGGCASQDGLVGGGTAPVVVASAPPETSAIPIVASAATVHALSTAAAAASAPRHLSQGHPAPTGTATGDIWDKY